MFILSIFTICACMVADLNTQPAGLLLASPETSLCARLTASESQLKVDSESRYNTFASYYCDAQYTASSANVYVHVRDGR